MRLKFTMYTLILLLMLNVVSLADRELGRSEIVEILAHLTANPIETWIQAGQIEATHEQYRAPKITDEREIQKRIREEIFDYIADPDKPERAEYLQKMRLEAMPFNVRYELSNESTETSREVIKFDGERFYWEIEILSRTDSVKPEKKLIGNFMTDQFDMESNRRRVYAWNGQEYVRYSPLATQASIDVCDRVPRKVNGPLTAGITPWGYGYYTYDNLSSLELSAVEKDIDDQIQIQLTITDPRGLEMIFLLDPMRDYAVLSRADDRDNNIVKIKRYSDYRFVSDRWVPFEVSIEKVGPSHLLAHDLWRITSIDPNVPAIERFDVEFDEDTTVEYFSSLSGPSLIYQHSMSVDTENLLSEKLVYISNQGSQQQNCATASMKYAARQLGKELTDSQLAQIVAEPNGTTSLYMLKKFAEDVGFHCRTVRTDLETLKALNNCQKILYIPSQKHFVVIDSIDEKHIGVVDLAGRKFFYQAEVGTFNMNWPDGIALLLSNESIYGDFVDIEDTELPTIVGASGYTCTNLLQEHDILFCVFLEGECVNWYIEWYERWGCEEAESGECPVGWYFRYSRIACVEDIYNPFACTVTGNWINRYMRACA